jgi:hypothetical protein
MEFIPGQIPQNKRRALPEEKLSPQDRDEILKYKHHPHYCASISAHYGIPQTAVKRIWNNISFTPGNSPLAIKLEPLTSFNTVQIPPNVPLAKPSELVGGALSPDPTPDVRESPNFIVQVKPAIPAPSSDSVSIEETPIKHTPEKSQPIPSLPEASKNELVTRLKFIKASLDASDSPNSTLESEADKVIEELSKRGLIEQEEDATSEETASDEATPPPPKKVGRIAINDQKDSSKIRGKLRGRIRKQHSDVREESDPEDWESSGVSSESSVAETQTRTKRSRGNSSKKRDKRRREVSRPQAFSRREERGGCERCTGGGEGPEITRNPDHSSNYSARFLTRLA